MKIHFQTQKHFFWIQISVKRLVGRSPQDCGGEIWSSEALERNLARGRECMRSLHEATLLRRSRISFQRWRIYAGVPFEKRPARPLNFVLKTK